MDRNGSIAQNEQCLDTVRALHQTVVSLRQALEQSRSEIVELKSKAWPLDSVEEALRNLSIENHVLRQKIVGYKEKGFGSELGEEDLQALCPNPEAAEEQSGLQTSLVSRKTDLDNPKFDKVSEKPDRASQKLDKGSQKLDKGGQKLDKVGQKLDEVSRKLDAASEKHKTTQKHVTIVSPRSGKSKDLYSSDLSRVKSPEHISKGPGKPLIKQEGPEKSLFHTTSKSKFLTSTPLKKEEEKHLGRKLGDQESKDQKPKEQKHKELPKEPKQHRLPENTSSAQKSRELKEISPRQRTSEPKKLPQKSLTFVKEPETVAEQIKAFVDKKAAEEIKKFDEALKKLDENLGKSDKNLGKPDENLNTSDTNLKKANDKLKKSEETEVVKRQEHRRTRTGDYSSEFHKVEYIKTVKSEFKPIQKFPASEPEATHVKIKKHPEGHPRPKEEHRKKELQKGESSAKERLAEEHPIEEYPVPKEHSIVKGHPVKGDLIVKEDLIGKEDLPLNKVPIAKVITKEIKELTKYTENVQTTLQDTSKKTVVTEKQRQYEKTEKLTRKQKPDAKDKENKVDNVVGSIIEKSDGATKKDHKQKHLIKEESRQKHLVKEESRQKHLAKEESKRKHLTKEESKHLTKEEGKHLAKEEDSKKYLPKEESHQKHLAKEGSSKKYLSKEERDQKHLAIKESDQQHSTKEKIKQKHLVKEEHKQKHLDKDYKQKHLDREDNKQKHSEDHKHRKRIVDVKIDVTLFKPSKDKTLSITIPPEVLYQKEDSEGSSERELTEKESIGRDLTEKDSTGRDSTGRDSTRRLSTGRDYSGRGSTEHYSTENDSNEQNLTGTDLTNKELTDRVDNSSIGQSFDHSSIEKNEFEDIIDDTEGDIDSLYSNGELAQYLSSEEDFRKEPTVPRLDIHQASDDSEQSAARIVISTENLSPRKISRSLENLVLTSPKKTEAVSKALSFSKTLSYSNISDFNVRSELNIEKENTETKYRGESKFVCTFQEFIKMTDETGKTNSFKHSDEHLGQNTTGSDRLNNLRPINMQESQELEPEVDEVELIFTTDETKEEDFKEELVSIEMNTDGPQHLQPISDFDQNLSHESNLSTELEDDVFNDNFENENQENSNFQSQTFDFQRENSALYNSKSDNSINHEEKSQKSYYSYQDSSFENKSLEKDESFDRFEERVRIIETDISKVGIHDVEYSLGRRNTCPNPIQYRPILHREALGKSAFGTRKTRPILAHSNAARKESGAQTDISALPGSSWRSESNLVHKVKVGDNFTTLPSKFAMPGNRLRLSDKTVEARRVLLSDIGFTSMVPELSRSADHLCPPNFKPPAPSTTPFGQFLRTPDLYSPGFQSQKFMWNASTATPSEGSHTHSRYSSLYPLTSPPVPTRRCSAPVSPSRRCMMKQTPSRVRFANGSLPELRGDWTSTIDSGDSTDSLVEEAEHYLRRSIDCIASGRDCTYRSESSKGNLRRASAPEPSRDNVPPQGWQPFLPRIPRDLRLDHWVKVISPEGRVRGGRVRYVGPLFAQSEQFVGVQLSNPDGNCDGTYNSRRYFQCEPYHGIFVPFKKVVMGWRP